MGDRIEKEDIENNEAESRDVDNRDAENKLSYSIRLTLFREEKFFGPGIACLLKGIRDSGSLNFACQSMNMSYTKGWKILNETEKNLGRKLVARKTGGTGGGSSELTEDGQKILAAYEEMLKRMIEYGDKQFEECFKELI